MTPREIELDQAKHADTMARAATPRVPRLLVDAAAPPPADLTLNLVHEPQHWSAREEQNSEKSKAGSASNSRRKQEWQRRFMDRRTNSARIYGNNV